MYLNTKNYLKKNYNHIAKLPNKLFSKTRSGKTSPIISKPFTYAYMFIYMDVYIMHQ